MRRIILATLLLLGLLAMQVTAQVCGDINNDGKINLQDYSHLSNYILAAGAPWTPWMDIDDCRGVALGDILRLTDYLYGLGANFDCTPGQTCSFAPSPNDTIFIPRMMSVPAGLSTVQLPVNISLQPGSHGVLFYLRPNPDGAEYFLADVQTPSVTGAFSSWAVNIPSGSSYIVWRKSTENLPTGSHEYFRLVYRGVLAGDSIAPEAYDLDTLLRVSVERNGDLVVPTIVYYDYGAALPPDTLKVSVPNLAFTSVAGREINDTVAVSFTSTGSNITFDLSAGQPWLTLVGVSGPLTTPVTINVTVNAGSVTQGSYSGMLAISNANSGLGAVVPQPTTPVALTVGAPINYPPGDVSCDGILDLVDLSMIIARLTGAHGPLQPCK